MATIDYKQKIKDYMNSSEVDTLYKSMLNNLFPELKESESKDERIGKFLLESFKSLSKACPNGFYRDDITYKDVTAWLEKQGKQKSIWHNENEEPQRGSLILLVMQSGTPIVAKIIEPNHTFNHGERWAYIDDWLEKQGEQKSTDTCDSSTINGKEFPASEKRDFGYFSESGDKIEPKFKIGDIIVKKDCHNSATTHKVINIEENNYILQNINDKYGSFDKNIIETDKNYELIKYSSSDEVKPKFHEGDIIKPKDGGHEPWQIMQVDILDKKYRFKDGYVIHFSQEDNYELVEQKPTKWHREDEQNLNACLGYIPDEFLRRWLQDAIHVKYDKHAWSEEDEKMFELALNMIEWYSVVDKDKSRSVSDWLKSLKDRYTWKPNDEQMQALSNAGNSFRPFEEGHKVLWSLYNDLKKLREE